jgi:tyrosyl-tRNA synthetase
VTALIHGKDEADKAMSGARAAFGGGGDKSAIPTVALPLSKFEAGYNIVDLFADAGLASTKSEARRLALQGGAFVSSDGSAATLAAITDVTALIGADALSGEGELLLRAGKKRFCRVVAG